MTTETHEFYVVEYDSSETPKLFDAHQDWAGWKEEPDIAYEPDPNWNGSCANDLSNAKRYTKLGADRKVKKEKQMFVSEMKIRVRKVKAIYEFIEEEK